MARLFFKLLRGIVCVEDRRACFLVHMPGDDLPPFGRVFGRHDIFARHHDAALSAHGLLALGVNQVELSGAQGENVLGEFKRQATEILPALHTALGYIPAGSEPFRGHAELLAQAVEFSWS